MSVTAGAVRGVRWIRRQEVEDVTEHPLPSVVESPQGEATAARSTFTQVVAAAAVLLTALGLVIALFFAYLFGLSALQASRGQHQLLAQFNGEAGLAAIAGKAPADGQAAAILSIPALHFQQVVVEGTSSTDLQSGPGLMPGTAAPGTLGDAVIAGRRTTFGGSFGAIGTMRAGETVAVTTAQGIYRYVVTDVRAISGSDAVPVGQRSAARLLLVTSRSSFPPSGWLVVRATLRGRPLPTREVSNGIPTNSELQLSGDAGAALPSLLWGELLAIMIVVAVLAYRRSRQPYLTYLLAMPLILVVALLCFENVARLLPATM